ncbi:MAG: cytochrome c biogenesis protein CcsA [Nitrospirota bacterium]
MNIPFFHLAMGAYALGAFGYIVFILKPAIPRIAFFSRWTAVAGFLFHLGYFLSRWIESGRIPITSFFEAANFLGMGIVLVFLLMEFRFAIAALGSFVLPLVLILMLPVLPASSAINYVNPLLASGWLGVHTSLTILGDAAFAFSFIVSLMYLIQERQLKARHHGILFDRLPSLEMMDTLSYRALVLGWPLFTLGMFAGAVWGSKVWGAAWSWGLKETWSIATWLVYLLILHLRSMKWRGRKMACMSIIGFIFVIINFYVISRIPMGKHTF